MGTKPPAAAAEQRWRDQAMREEVAAWLLSASQTLVDVAGVVSLVFLVGFGLSIFRRTRPWTGAILYWFSFLAGAATWFYGAGITFASFGWVGLFVGLVLLGVGVVPMGVIGGAPRRRRAGRDGAGPAPDAGRHVSVPGRRRLAPPLWTGDGTTA